MGNPMIGGTHWLAVSNKDKVYFDPLNLPRPKVIPKDYSYRKIGVQTLVLVTVVVSQCCSCTIYSMGKWMTSTSSSNNTFDLERKGIII
ncbi:hypothetical protein Plhal710r2_c028g0106871 [Plasmopara halstedii]